MTKKELLNSLKNVRLDYYTMMYYATSFVKADPYKSRLINYMLGRSKLQINFTTTDMLRWFIDFTKADFLETEFFKCNGNHLQVLKSIWYESQLYPEVIEVIKSGKPLNVVTTINEQLEEVKADVNLTDKDRQKLVGQLRAQRMREAKAIKREDRLREEAKAKNKEIVKKQQVVKSVEPKQELKNPTVNLQGHRREMTDEELQIINNLKKLNVE